VSRTAVSRRIKLVEDLSDALDQHHRKADAVTAAEEAERQAAHAVRDAYTAAQNGGWTTRELTTAGLEPPRGIRRRKRSTTGGRPDNGNTGRMTVGTTEAPRACTATSVVVR